jgi:hypothetical protein
MPHDDGHMTETCCGNNIEGRGEELLRWQTINCLMNDDVCILTYQFTSGRLHSLVELYTVLAYLNIRYEVGA